MARYDLSEALMRIFIPWRLLYMVTSVEHVSDRGYAPPVGSDAPRAQQIPYTAPQAPLQNKDDKMVKVAFLGLGVMGYPMARHLAAKGHAVTVYNRTTAKAESWVAENGGRLATTPKQAASGQDIVFACVGNDNDLRDVTLGDGGAFIGMAGGAIFVDHTTASAGIARELHAAAAARGFGFLDARFPVARPAPKTASSPSWSAATSLASLAPNR